MKEYYPSLSSIGSALGSFLENTLQGLQSQWAKVSQVLSNLLEKVGSTTVFPQILPETVSFIENKYLLQMFETVAISRDKEFMEAIRVGRDQAKKGKLHNFSELLSEYGIE